VSASDNRYASAALSLYARGIRRLALHAQLLKYRVLATRGHLDFIRFIVLTRSRTGSNLLLSFLNGHSDIFCDGEIFARMRGKDPLVRLGKAFGKQPRHVLARGFKIFYYHPLDADGGMLWTSLADMQDLKVIHLTRSNILRTLVSRKIAGVQDRWTGTRYDAVGLAARRIHFSIQELESGFRQTRAWETEAEARFRGHSLLRITYEELVGDPPDAYDRALDFLGMRKQAPRTSLRRQNPENLRELIRNYDELKEHFSSSPWHEFFEE
jgi:LPS sulfotransferase NodH